MPWECLPRLRKLHLKIITLLVICLVSLATILNHSLLKGIWRTREHAPGQPIFFVETSGRAALHLREVCAIESAARAHPESNVTFLSSSPGPISAFSGHGPGTVDIPRELMPNVNPVPLRVSLIFQGTPFTDWYSSGMHRVSGFPVEHLSDALRLALLWKHGGIYLDLDVIVLRSLAGLRNVVGLESADSANGAVLAFAERSGFLESCMEEYVAGYKPEVWGHQGPLLLTRMLLKFCGGDNLVDFIAQPHNCRGVTVLPVRSFYPVHFNRWERLFLQMEDVAALAGMKDRSFVVHLWAKFSRDRKTYVGSGSALDALARDYCPLTYKYMQQETTF